MLVVANWPAARATHWRTLLAARAIENQCFVVGVNRLGTDGNQVSYQGDSMILDFQGEPIVDASVQPGLFYAELDLASLSDYRAAFPAWMDQDRFNLE
jgi:predicted amidohydrolase